MATMLDAALSATGPDSFDGYQRALGQYQQALLTAALTPPG
jgi:hypothetical protein